MLSSLICIQMYENNQQCKKETPRKKSLLVFVSLESEVIVIDNTTYNLVYKICVFNSPLL
jgi:hypothetical protein